MGSCFRSYINSIRKNFFFSLNSGTQPTLPNKDGIDPFYQHKMLDDDISISGVGLPHQKSQSQSPTLTSSQCACTKQKPMRKRMIGGLKKFRMV